MSKPTEPTQSAQQAVPNVPHFAISQTTAQQILDFLVQQPYLHVAHLIKGLQSLPPVTMSVAPAPAPEAPLPPAPKSEKKKLASVPKEAPPASAEAK